MSQSLSDPSEDNIGAFPIPEGTKLRLQIVNKRIHRRFGITRMADGTIVDMSRMTAGELCDLVYECLTKPGSGTVQPAHDMLVRQAVAKVAGLPLEEVSTSTSLNALFKPSRVVAAKREIEHLLGCQLPSHDLTAGATFLGCGTALAAVGGLIALIAFYKIRYVPGGKAVFSTVAFLLMALVWSLFRLLLSPFFAQFRPSNQKVGNLAPFVAARLGDPTTARSCWTREMVWAEIEEILRFRKVTVPILPSTPLLALTKTRWSPIHGMQ